MHRQVAETELPNGMWVSTIWIGIDISGGADNLFETAVFLQSGEAMGLPIEEWRYSTEEWACKGHQELVEKWSTIKKTTS